MSSISDKPGRTIAFVVPGDAAPKERARARIVQVPGKKPFISHYTPKETREYEEKVKAIAWRAWGANPPSKRPIEMQITVHVQIPPGWPKWKQEAAMHGEIAPTGVPDLDNFAKSIGDAMNGTVYADDSQVVAVDMVKLYATDGFPRVEVQLRENWRSGSWITRLADFILLR